MKTTSAYLDEVLPKLHLRNDSELARAWALPHTRISEYRSGKRSLPDERVVYVAELLGIDVGEIFTAIAIERAQRTRNQPALERLSQFAKKAGFSVLLLSATGLSGAPGQARAAVEVNNNAGPNYTLCEVRVLQKLWLECIALSEES